MKVLSIHTTQELKRVSYKNKEWETAIWKPQVKGPVFLDKLGLVGDRQANLDVHGGEGRALYVFGRKTYELWREVINPELWKQNGIFGENLTMEEIDEAEIHVGDHFSLGETIIEATMPRFPCFLFAERIGYSEAQDFMYKTNKPGVLFRAIQTGRISEGDPLKLIQKSKYNLTMPQFLQMGHNKTITRENLDFLKTIPVIPKITIDRLEYRLIHGR